MRKICLSLALIGAMTQSLAAFAVEDEFGIEHPSRKDDSNGIERAVGGEYPGAISSIDAMQLGEVSGESLSNSARYALSRNNYDKAIQLSKLAIEKNYDDADTHMIYAEALEKKYNKQVQKDPTLFNKCVKEWLMVFRDEVGMEKGMSGKGRSIPLLQNFYKDDDHGIPARQHILGLTGFTPKWFESDDRFMAKVSKPTDELVSGKVMASDGKAVKNTQSAAGKTSDGKQISVRNGSVGDSKKLSLPNEE